MEELLDRIDELEGKLNGLIERYESRVRAEATEVGEVEALRSAVEELQQENDRMKETLEKVRQRVARLLDRVEALTLEAENSAELF